MRRRDDGTALVEFTWLAVLLLVPLAYLVVTVFRVQSAALGASAAARAAARAYVTTVGAPTRRGAAASDAARLALGDQGVDTARLPAGWLAVSLAPYDAGVPPTRMVRVDVRFRLALPWVPSFVAGVARVGVSAHHDEPLDDYAASG